MAEHASYDSVSPELLKRLHQDEAAMDEYCDGLIEVSASCDLGKSWDGVRYLIDPQRRNTAYWTSYSKTLVGRAVLGGEVLNGPYAKRNGMEDFSPRYLLPDEVEAIADALSRLTEKDLKAAFDHQEMGSPGDPNMEVYGYVGRKLGSDEAFGYYRGRFETLRGFYSAAAMQGNAVIVFLF